MLYRDTRKYRDAPKGAKGVPYDKKVSHIVKKGVPYCYAVALENTATPQKASRNCYTVTLENWRIESLFKSSKLSLFLIETFLKVGKVLIGARLRFFINADLSCVKGAIVDKITPEGVLSGCSGVRVFGLPGVQ